MADAPNQTALRCFQPTVGEVGLVLEQVAGSGGIAEYHSVYYKHA